MSRKIWRRTYHWSMRPPWEVDYFTYLPKLMTKHIIYPVICLIMFIWLTLFYGTFRHGECTADKRTNYHKIRTLFDPNIRFDSWPEWSHYSIYLSQYKTNQTPGFISTWCTICLNLSHPCMMYIKDYFYHRLRNRRNHTGQLGKKDVLFRWPSDEVYTSYDLNDHIKLAMTLLKHFIPKYAKLKIEDYSGHSFRIGSATLLTVVGVKRWVIQILGRWRSLDNILLYPKMSVKHLCSYMTRAERIVK